VIGAPYFPHMDIALENGRHIVIDAPAVSDRNRYIQSLRVDGQPWNKLTLPHALLAQGATLEFTMGPKPSRWASDDAALPPSLTVQGAPSPLRDITDGAEPVATPALAQPAALSDNDSSTEAALPAGSSTFDWHLAQPRSVAMLTLTSGATAMAPDGWQLQGSVDGRSWHTLDTRRHERFAWPRQTRAFALRAAGHYAYFRLHIDAADAPRSLAEIELLGP
jgi:hypothetical protein